VIGGLLVTILIFNLLLFVLVSGMTPDPNELLRLLCFFLIAFVYLMVFYGTTMLVSLKTRDSGYGFLLMMIVWLTITFVLPQLADSQRSFAYAQSATGQIITQVPADTIVSQMIELFSPAAQFQNIGQNLLQVIPETAGSGPGAVLFKQWVSLVAIVIPGLAVLFFTYLSARKVEVL
jgi:ABC-2 type transport system permease protein